MSGASVQTKNRTPSPQAPVKPSRIRIPPAITIELQNLDPLLQANWQTTVHKLFAQLDNAQRNYVYRRHLLSKGISLDQEQNKLVFAGRPGLREIKQTVSSKQLGGLIGKLQSALERLRQISDVNEYADLLEGSVGIIETFEVNGELGLQKARRMVRQAFLDDLVGVTREAKLTISDNQRGLTVEIVKEYIVEVYLRQQMLKYRFHTIPIDELNNHPEPFIRDTIAPEAEIRQCDVVGTDRNLFLVGPVRSIRMNPYSVRRFLSEEQAMNGSTVFFNATAVPFNTLKSEKITKHIAWSVSRIVTLERQVCQDIKNLIASFQQTRLDTLLPLLKREIEADGSDLEDIISKKMVAYEQILTSDILSKLPWAIKNLAKSADDHDYLLYFTRELLLVLANDIRDFSGQFAVSCSLAAEELELRVLSYFSLLEKRKDDLFIVNSHKSPANTIDVRRPTLEFKATLCEFDPKIGKVAAQIQQLEDEAVEKKGKWALLMDKMFDRTEKRRMRLDSLYSEHTQLKRKCLVGLIRICKKHTDSTIFLEFEDIIEVDESKRHYALPAGADGIGSLPTLVRLWEDATLFNVAEIQARLGVNLA